MDKALQELFANLSSTDDKIRMTALQTILKLSDEKVEWVYEVWDNLFERLNHPNSYQRSIAIMVLCNLAKSDSENRIKDSIQLILTHTKDEKFITSRLCLQNSWKLALTNQPNRVIVIDHFEKRFIECVAGKHYNLIRLDIIQSLVNLSNETKDETIISRVGELTSKESFEKYRRFLSTS